MLRRDADLAVRRLPSPVVLPRPGVAVACATSRFEQAAGHKAGAGVIAAGSGNRGDGLKNWDRERERELAGS